ncbi:MAG TPA: hypothetical protein VJ233_00800 [Hyphomicrobiaceae bacterium]|nr:hypothetical protein [Hyphomicrobiaceae bacterium]
MTIGIGTFAFELALPFETGGIDASGFTVAPGTAQGERARPAAGPSDEQAASLLGRIISCLATCIWIGASAVVR